MNKNLKLILCCSIIGLSIISYSNIKKETKRREEIVRQQELAKIKRSNNLIKSRNKMYEYIISNYHNKIQLKIQKEIEKEKQHQFKLKKEVERKKKERLNRGGITNYSYIKRVKCKITYYTNENSPMEGGRYDKKGKLLTSHNEPVVALPSNVPYGSYLLLDSPINGSKKFKNVDTGDAIIWSDSQTMKVDVFVPNVTPRWIERNLQNKVVWGYLYYK